MLEGLLNFLPRRRGIFGDRRFTLRAPAQAMCNVSGMAYPVFRTMPAAEERKLLNDLKLPTIEELMYLLQRHTHPIRKKASNFLYSMGNAYETALLGLEFNNTDVANIGDAGGLQNSAAAGSFYVALHTADPGEAGDQTSNEATFTSYARQAVARSAGGWTISGNQVSNTAAITFAQNSGSDQTVTHFSIGAISSGASIMVRYGPLVASGALWLPFTATTADVLTIPQHTFVVDDRFVGALGFDSTLPTGLTGGTVYWIKTVSGNDFTLSTTQGGGTLDLTAVGSGVCVEAKPLVVRGGIDSVQFAAGQLVSKSD